MLQLARTALLVGPKHTATALLQTRLASSHSDSHHDDGADEYPKEVGFYKYAPSSNEDAYITRWIKHYMTSSEEWEKMNMKHLTLTQEASDHMLLSADAQRPKKHVYRYPQMFDQFSPHKNVVGDSVDFSAVKVTGDKDS